jgi:hypothetical protein
MSGGRATSIRIGGAVAAVLGASGLLFATSSAAGAAGSTSPPAGGVATSCSTSTTITTSSTPQSVTLGETCAFTPNSSVTISFQGTTVTTATADATGLISLSVTANDPSISINGGAAQTAVYGVNTFVATGTNASGATNTATFLIDLEQAATPATPSTPLAFTGADLAALIAAALALVLLGTGVVLYTRRRADESPSA